MAATSVTRVRESPFRESDWDRRLDNMLEDLETGAVPEKTVSSMSTTKTQQFFSSQTQSTSSFSNQQGTRSQSVSQSQSQQRAMVSNNGGGGGRGAAPAGNGFQLAKSDSAKDVLKDLESGILKSTNYIESHKKYTGPEGSQEFHEYKSNQDPDTFNLERQVQHMIPSGSLSERKGGFSSQNMSLSSQQHQQQQQQSSSQNLTTYKVQSNQYTGAGDRVTSVSPQPVSPAPTWPDQDDDNRPGSRLKQNIDDLDTLLYDLNNAKNISDGGADYTASSVGVGGLDSDDYSETVGQQGHVKRTINAFNEYTSQMEDYSRKPPSPSPRRKTNPSPTVVRKTPPAPAKPSQPTVMSSHQSSSSSSYKVQSTNMDQRTTSQEPRVTEPYLPNTGPPGSGQPFSYIGDSPPTSPDLTTPSYFTKYHSSEQTNHSRSKREMEPTSVPFPSSQPHAPSTQSPPKRVEELMSEFDQFDSVHSNGTPTPSMFAKPNNSTVVVTELPDEPLHVVNAIPKDPSPPKSKPGPKGPDVYYPPGSDFKVVEKAPLSVAPAPAPVDGGTMSLDRDNKRGRGKERAERKDKFHDRGMDGGEKQGAAVIPICLPLCCAAPCVIM